MDNLHTTAAHELFQLVQREYLNRTKYLNWYQIRDGGKFVWFCEATTLVLEDEAEAHYLNELNEHWVANFHNTYGKGKFIGLFKLPLDAMGPIERETQEKGYAASRFLMDLQSRYNPANREAFLPALLKTLGTYRTGAVDALQKATSRSDAILGLEYIRFCSQSSTDIYTFSPLSVTGSLRGCESIWKGSRGRGLGCEAQARGAVRCGASDATSNAGFVPNPRPPMGLRRHGAIFCIAAPRRGHRIACVAAP